MGILVDKSATFEISFSYRLIKNDDDKTIGVAFADEEGWAGTDYQEFKSIWVPATHEEMTFIREESSVINHVNEKAILLLKEFRPRLICAFCKDWNLTDESGYPLPVTREVIANMFENFVIKIIEEWKKATAGEFVQSKQNIPWETVTRDLFNDILQRIVEMLKEN